MSNTAFTFGGFTVPADCRRIFITAELEPSNGDPRIQPTGFPDIGPVLYADPNPDKEKNCGLICLIESEASMANWLEAVCLADKYTGKLKEALKGLPHIKLTDTGLPDGRLITSSTIDGHRFASEYIMNATGRVDRTAPPISMHSFDGNAIAENKAPDPDPAQTKTKGGKGKKTKASSATPEFVSFVRDYLGMEKTDKCPAANVPDIFVLAMEYDPLSLLHGFQISIKDKLTFVGLRSPRALTASITGLNCERVLVPGVRIDPIGTGDAGQAIFQKQRITAQKIEARFSIDVGLIASLRLVNAANKDAAALQAARMELLVALALWKVAVFLTELEVELSMRTECKLRLRGTPQLEARASGNTSGAFPYKTIAKEDLSSNGGWISKCGFDPNRSPLVLKFTPKKEKPNSEPGESAEPGEESTDV